MPGSHRTADDTLIERWLTQFETVNTRRAYAADIASFREAVGRPLQQLRQRDVDQYISLVQQTPSVLRRRIAALRSFFQFSFYAGHLRHEFKITIQAMPTPEPSRRLDILTESQIMQILRSAEDVREYCIIGMAYYGAIGAKEQVGLRWADIEIGGRQITVTIGGHRPRTVRLPEFLAPKLRELRASATANMPVLASRVRDGDGDIKPLNEHSVRRVFRWIAKRNGLPTNIQQLRNSHARHALSRGADLHAVGRTLGHRSIRTTARHLGVIKPDAPSGLVLPKPPRT